MFSASFLWFQVLMTLGALALIAGCGKKTQIHENEFSDITRPSQTERDSYLSKQDISCQGNQACPNFIAKIVVIHGDSYRYCTGFLTADNVVATSSSCLPNLLRLNGQDCSKDVFFFFPKTWNQPLDKVSCKKVIYASGLQGADPILWRDDVAFLEITKNLPYRRKVKISREGVSDNNMFTSWVVDQQDDHNALIKKSECISIHSSYINPLVTGDSSPNMLFADCLQTKHLGETGAPILDSRGRVRAMISRPMDAGLRYYLESTGLLNDGLKQIIHASNFACAPTNENNEMNNEKECLKDLNYSLVDSARSEMLSSEQLFKEMRTRYVQSLNELSPYLEFGVKFFSLGDIQKSEIYPRCFKPLSTWLYSMGNNRNFVHNLSLPFKSFRRVMNSHGRVSGAVLDYEVKEFFIQFSLKNLRSNRNSSIMMWPKDEETRYFPEVSEKCMELLL